MSMHQAVNKVFTHELFSEYPNVVLTGNDVNRIVTNVVKSFDLEKSTQELLKEQIVIYIDRYKMRAGKRDCGCSKK